MMRAVIFAGLVAVAAATGGFEDGQPQPEPPQGQNDQMPPAVAQPQPQPAQPSQPIETLGDLPPSGPAVPSSGPLPIPNTQPAEGATEANDNPYSGGAPQPPAPAGGEEEAATEEGEMTLDEVEPTPKGESVLKLMAMRKLQYLNDANTRHIFNHTSQLPVVKALIKLYDLDKDGHISIGDWNGFFIKFLLPYYTKALGLKKPSADMWSAVSKTGKDLVITRDLFPTLHSMTTEEIFDMLAASLFWFYDLDKDGYLNSKEMGAFKASPAYLDEKFFPLIKRRPLGLFLNKILLAQQKQATCKIVNRFKAFGHPLHPSLVKRFC